MRKNSVLQMITCTNSMHNLQSFHQNIYLLITLLSIVTNCLFVATELFHLRIHYLCLICVTINTHPYKSDGISSKNTFSVKKRWPSISRIIPGSEYMSRLATTRSDIRMWPRPIILNTSTTLNTL